MTYAARNIEKGLKISTPAEGRVLHSIYVKCFAMLHTLVEIEYPNQRSFINQLEIKQNQYMLKKIKEAWEQFHNAINTF